MYLNTQDISILKIVPDELDNGKNVSFLVSLTDEETLEIRAPEGVLIKQVKNEVTKPNFLEPSEASINRWLIEKLPNEEKVDTVLEVRIRVEVPYEEVDGEEIKIRTGRENESIPLKQE